ncbi:terminase [Homoserinibacter sp. GY 40078]|uniref:terminase n=1 Tax=Homoserinibacter sp. GY 40078 TaxID=2603275 RepID=UPI0011CB3657|nr:terminase [Homoserinibacter sp. GY 40078]TXK17397.1 terminase [Homoserinibacter sp. GY 40078]
MPWRPLDDEPFPTLGYHVADQMSEYLGFEVGGELVPFVPTLEMLEFLVDFYEIDPVSCRRVKRRGILQRPRGWGKSPNLAALGIAEALFEVVPDGWDADGQPVARPWLSIKRTVNVPITATSEDQVKNTWQPLLAMVTEGSLVDEFDIDPMDSFISMPGGGKIEARTSAGRSIKGLPDQVAAVLDQTEEWVKGNGGHRLAQNLRNNATKAGGVIFESPNAFTPGEGSVAEMSALDWEKIKSGKYPDLAEARQVLYDHREAPPDTDPSDRDSLIAGLRYAYGDSSDDPRGCVLHDPPCAPGWAPIEGTALAFLDTSNDPQVLRADFLNQITHSLDSWLSQPEVRAIVADGEGGRAEPKTITRTEPVVLGFDGSQGRKDDRIADSTVLIGYSIRQRHFFVLGMWEQPDGPAGRGWRPPELEIEKTVDDAHKRYNVVGFFADPSAGWAGNVKNWEAKHGRKYKAKLSRDNPIQWKQKDVSRTCETFDQLHAQIVAADVTVEAHPRLIAHMINGRRDPRRSGYVVKKPDDDQDYSKVDACWGLMLCFAAALVAIGAGVNTQTRRMPRQLA